MASKLRRTPLFGYDGNLGIPILPASSSSGSKNNDSSQQDYGYKHHTMDGCVTSSPAYAASSNNSSNNSKSQTGHSNGHGTVNPNNRLPSSNGRSSDSYSPHNTPSTPNKHVNFGGQGPSEERKREKFLTAKYGAHQMALIRKRLRVEMWMYERLQEIYGADDIEIDLDEVLDLDDELERRRYISELLRVDHGNAVSKDNVNVFVGDLLERVKTL